MDIEVLEDERVEDLQVAGLLLIQKRAGFRFGLDSVLVSGFADVKKDAEVLDIGTGSGIISVLLSQKTKAKKIVGLELQLDIADMAKRTVALNQLSDRIEIRCGDARQAESIFGASSFDVVVTNPPYMQFGGALINTEETKTISRHEIYLTLEDVIRVSSKLLRPQGHFAMVHKPERLTDIICLMREHRIEPKYLQFVHARTHKKPSLILIKGNRGGKPQLIVKEPLYVFDEMGNYTEEINRMYGK